MGKSFLNINDGQIAVVLLPRRKRKHCDPNRGASSQLIDLILSLRYGGKRSKLRPA